MLSSREYEILSYISKNSPIPAYLVNNHFNPQELCNENEAIMRSLAARKRIFIDFAGNCRILPEGTHEILLYEDQQKHIQQQPESAAKEKKDKALTAVQKHKDGKRDRLIAIIGLVIAILTFAFQFGDDLVALLQNLFVH